MTTISGQEFQNIATAMFGGNWRKPMADAIGLSYARVSQLSKAETLSSKAAAKVIQLHNSWKANGSIVPVSGLVVDAVVVKDEDANLTDEQIVGRINQKFNVMEKMVDGMMKGIIRSMIVSGAPGIGKTFLLEQKLKKAHREDRLDYHIVRGTCSAPGLYQSLYHAKDGGIVVIDDCDSIFGDEQAFNILKAALDTSNERTIAWRKQSSWIYDVNDYEAGSYEVLGDKFPNEFDFKGAVVFITNLNFREMANKGGKLAPHFSALLSRSMYLDLTLRSKRARVLRIKDVFFSSMRKNIGLTAAQGNEVIEYVLDNADRLDELSLRSVKHIADLYLLGDDWQEICEHTKCVTPRMEDFQ